MITALTSLMVAVIGAFIGYIFRGLDYQKNETLARLDDIVKQTEAISECAKTYWSKKRDTDDEGASFIALESEIIGRLHFIARLIAGMEGRISPIAGQNLQECLIKFRISTTDGDFRAQARIADGARIQNIYNASADLISLCRDIGREFLRGPIQRAWTDLFGKKYGHDYE